MFYCDGNVCLISTYGVLKYSCVYYMLYYGVRLISTYGVLKYKWCSQFRHIIPSLISTYGVLKLIFLLRSWHPAMVFNINIWCFEMQLSNHYLLSMLLFNINIWCFEIIWNHLIPFLKSSLISTYGVLKWVYGYQKTFLHLD